MEVDEQNIEDLFADAGDSENESGTRNEGTEGPGANLVLGERVEGSVEANGTAGKEIKPKRKIAKQPLLNVDRLLGKRGIGELEKVFEDFEPTPGKEYEDLDIVLNRMKHWAHRMYPKLPFDDVTKQIAKLGSKMQVQTGIKRIRLNLVPDPHVNNNLEDSEDETTAPRENNEDSTERYGDVPQVDVFEQLIREADERRAQEESHERIENSQNFGEVLNDTSNVLLSNEQKERILRNKRLAEEKRRKRVAEKMATSQIEDILQNMLL